MLESIYYPKITSPTSYMGHLVIAFRDWGRPRVSNYRHAHLAVDLYFFVSIYLSISHVIWYIWGENWIVLGSGSGAERHWDMRHTNRNGNRGRKVTGYNQIEFVVFTVDGKGLNREWRSQTLVLHGIVCWLSGRRFLVFCVFFFAFRILVPLKSASVIWRKKWKKNSLIFQRTWTFL